MERARARFSWGDTASSPVSNSKPVTHSYPRQPADMAVSMTLNLSVSGVMCLSQASLSVPKVAAAVCPAGKAVVVSPNITIEGQMAHVTFSIAPGCSAIEVSLATYTAPSAAIAYPQYLFDSDHPANSAPQTFNAGGPYALTAKVPILLLAGGSCPRTGDRDAHHRSSLRIQNACVHKRRDAKLPGKMTSL